MKGHLAPMPVKTKMPVYAEKKTEMTVYTEKKNEMKSSRGLPTTVCVRPAGPGVQPGFPEGSLKAHSCAWHWPAADSQGLYNTGLCGKGWIPTQRKSCSPASVAQSYRNAERGALAGMSG